MSVPLAQLPSQNSPPSSPGTAAAHAHHTWGVCKTVPSRPGDHTRARLGHSGSPKAPETNPIPLGFYLVP